MKSGFSIRLNYFIFRYLTLCSIFSASFWLGSFSILQLNTVESPLGYEACFSNLSFGVKSVICRLHNLRSPFKIPFYLVSRLGHTHFFTWGPYAAFFNGMALAYHIEGSMITAIWTLLRMFQNSKFYQFMLNVGGVDGSLHLPVPSMNKFNHTEPATFSILPRWAVFRDSYFILLYTIFNMMHVINNSLKSIRYY
jgi:hypothetical protein